jgi:hypothetical protein
MMCVLMNDEERHRQAGKKNFDEGETNDHLITTPKKKDSCPCQYYFLPVKGTRPAGSIRPSDPFYTNKPSPIFAVKK